LDHWPYTDLRKPVDHRLKKPVKLFRPQRTTGLMARVLLVDDDPTSRLTLQTVLEAGGYHVDAAASAAEAVGKMERKEYELVLSDLQMESPEAGLKVLAHARMMDYQPATAIVTTYQDKKPAHRAGRNMLIEPEDLPELLGKVAGLISDRATRRMGRRLRQS
jgi:CheY-like chemotaxis protein